MKDNKLGIGLISDRIGRHGRIVCLSIEKLGIVKDIKIINGEIVYPKGQVFSNKLRLRIKNYLGVWLKWELNLQRQKYMMCLSWVI